MTFMAIAFGAIGIGIILMVGYLVISQAQAGFGSLSNVSTNTTNIINVAQQQTNFAFGLVAIGIIAVAGLGIFMLFK